MLMATAIQAITAASARSHIGMPSVSGLCGLQAVDSLSSGR